MKVLIQPLSLQLGSLPCAPKEGWCVVNQNKDISLMNLDFPWVNIS